MVVGGSGGVVRYLSLYNASDVSSNLTADGRRYEPDYTQCGILHLNAAKALEIGCRCQLGTLHQDADAQQLLASCI